MTSPSEAPIGYGELEKNLFKNLDVDTMKMYNKFNQKEKEIFLLEWIINEGNFEYYELVIPIILDPNSKEFYHEIETKEQKEIFLHKYIIDEIDAIRDVNEMLERVGEISNEGTKSEYITLKPSCKYCKKPLVETDEDYYSFVDDLDDNGEVNQKLGYTDGDLNTLNQEIEDMQHQCEICKVDIPKFCFESGLCFLCYDDPWPLMQKTPGTIVIVEGKFLSCEGCREYSESVLS